MIVYNRSCTLNCIVLEANGGLGPVIVSLTVPLFTLIMLDIFKTTFLPNFIHLTHRIPVLQADGNTMCTVWLLIRWLLKSQQTGICTTVFVLFV